MASFTPWILLSFTLVLCVTCQRENPQFPPLDLCSCPKPDNNSEPEPSPQNVKRCFIQEKSRDCYHAIVVTTPEGETLCFDPTLPWIDDFIKRNACEPLICDSEAAADF